MIRVFGSVNLDLVANVRALPRAGETQSALGYRACPGGKGANQALAARRAGAEVSMHGAVGRDAFAGPALAGLREAGVDCDGVACVEGTTGLALIHVDAAGENTITVVPGANARARATSMPDAVLGPGTLLVVQLEVPMDEVEALAARARARGARVLLNAAPAAPLPTSLTSAIDVLVVNEHEAISVAGEGSGSDPAALAETLATRHGCTVVVTLGARGAVMHAGGMRWRAAPPRVDVVDTVGAGDAFTGAFAAALDRGVPANEALAFAVTAGALACSRPGAQDAMPLRPEIEALARTVAAARPADMPLS